MEKQCTCPPLKPGGTLTAADRLGIHYDECPADPANAARLERSLIDEIQSTRDGRAALRFASENCDLRELLDLANKLIVFAQEMADITCGQDDNWMSDFRKFSDLYKQDLEKRK